MPQLAEVEHYQFGPLERRGVLLGLSGGQLAALGGAGALALLALHVLPGRWAGVMSCAIAIAGGIAALMPVSGRPLEAWLPLVAGYGWRRLRGGHRFSSRAHLRGHLVRVRGDGAVLDVLPPEDRPLCLRDMRLLEVDAGDRQQPVGVIGHARRHTLVGILRARGGPFHLLDDSGQASAVRAWASILARYALESSPVSRLQWIERALPEDAHQLERHLQERSVRGAPPAAQRVCADAITEVRRSHVRRECLLAIQVDARRAWRQVRQAGGGSIERGACALLVRELAMLGERVEAAGMVVEEALGPKAIAEVIRSSYKPDARPRLRVIHGDESDAGPDPRNAWPHQTEEGFSHLRVGPSSFHATYHVREWPRIEVGPGFLAPLLAAACRRTVSMTLEPVPAARATRELRQALAGDVSDGTLREKAGWLPSFRRRREEENVLRAERELADGHASFRFSAYVSASAGNADELEASCAEVEQAAGQANLELDRLYAQQELAFTYTLPLCEGLA
jgi:hypothetical protein